MTDFESHKYRVEIEVARVQPTKDHPTTWRTLAVRDSYADVGDLGDYLISSLELAGIPREKAQEWADEHLRVKRVTITTVNGDPEPMLFGP